MHLLTLFVTALSLTTSVYALESRDGKDEGQSFCIGPCGAFEDSLKCDKPFVSVFLSDK